MDEVHEGYERKSFPSVNTQTSEVKEATICDISGKLATSLCKGHTHTEFFTNSTIPNEYCDVHVEVEICETSGKVATEHCPQDTRVKKVITRQIADGQVVGDEYCDVHTAENTAPEASPVAPEDTTLPEGTLPTDTPSSTPEDLPVEAPTLPALPSTPPVIEETPAEPVAPTPTPTTPAPVVPESPPIPSTNPDDDNPFYVPQG